MELGLEMIFPWKDHVFLTFESLGTYYLLLKYKT